MSDACHANTSTFARRKATSALSYLLSRMELIVKAPPVPSSWTGTFLVSGGAALDFLLLSAELSRTPLTGAQHSEEARLPEWVQEVLPEEVSPEGALPSEAEVFRSSSLPGLQRQEQVPWRQLLQLPPGKVRRRR